MKRNEKNIEGHQWYSGIVFHVSCGRNYVHGELAMSKLGGSLSVVKVLNFLSFHYINDQGFRGCSIVMECWSLINPGLLADRVFFLACPGFALRATSFNSGPCAGVSSRCWHSLRMPACSSFVLLLYLPIQKCETGETFNNSLVNFLGPKLQDEIESGLSKYGACPSASMKPYMKGIGRYRLGYRLRTPTFYPESVSGHSLQ